MEKKMLLYGFDKKSEKYKIINDAAKNSGIKVVEIRKEDVGQKVGVLMEIEGYGIEETNEVSAPDMEFILFSDFDRNILTDFLREIKNRGINVPYKSVITETTKDWNFTYLLNHIKEEHLVMTKFNKLGLLVKQAQDILEKKDKKSLKEALDFAMELKNFKEIDEKLIDERYFKLEKALEED